MRITKQRRPCAALALATILSLVAILYLAAGAAQAQTVHVGEIGNLGDAPMYIGIDKGYFAARHVEVSLERFNAGVQMTAPLSTDELQVAGGGMGAALFNAFARDWPVRIVGARLRDVKGYAANGLVTRPENAAKFKTLKDLNGARIAVNAPAGIDEYMLGRMLDTAGLSLKDIDTVYMGFPDMGPALQTKAIDIAFSLEPFMTQYADSKLAVDIVRSADVLPPVEISVLLYNADWMRKSPDQVRDFSYAYMQAVRDYYDAMKRGPKRDEVIDILINHTPLKDRAQYERMQWGYLDPNAELEVANMKDQQDWYAQIGTVPKKIDLAKMIDMSFMAQAVAKLGRVEAK